MKSKGGKQSLRIYHVLLSKVETAISKLWRSFKGFWNIVVLRLVDSQLVEALTAAIINVLKGKWDKACTIIAHEPEQQIKPVCANIVVTYYVLWFAERYTVHCICVWITMNLWTVSFDQFTNCNGFISLQFDRRDQSTGLGGNDEWMKFWTLWSFSCTCCVEPGVLWMWMCSSESGLGVQIVISRV